MKDTKQYNHDKVSQIRLLTVFVGAPDPLLSSSDRAAPGYVVYSPHLRPPPLCSCRQCCRSIAELLQQTDDNSDLFPEPDDFIGEDAVD